MPDLRLRGGEVDGLDLHYIVEGRGPAVILLHGLGGFAESWRHTLRTLAGRATVYALDLPGFGGSAKPRARYRLPYFAGALHGFMEALAIREVSLVGHSLGAAVAARLGMKAILALKGAPPEEYDGNLLLDRLLGAEVRFCSDDEWGRIDELLEDLAARVRSRGGAPYIIPESGATVTGALGYVTCGEELVQQIRHGAPAFDTVVITAFSGGSHAGLLMAKQLHGLRAEVVGVPIAWEAARVRAYVADLIGQARRRYGLSVEPPGEIRLLDGYQGTGRAEVRAEALETVVRVARLEGIVLDPVYTAKAFAALLDRIRRDPRELGPRVCFIHTGGIFSLFPYRRPLSRMLGGGGLVES